MNLGLMLKSIFFNKYLVSILGIVCTYLFLNNSEKIFVFIKRKIKGVVDFFKNKLFLVFILIVGIIFYSIFFSLEPDKNFISIKEAILFFFMLFIAIYVWYKDRISNYGRTKQNNCVKVMNLIRRLIPYLELSINFFILYALSDMYFVDSLEMIVVLLSIYMIFRQGWFIIQHCLDLLKIKKSIHNLKYKAFFFFYDILQIIQAFALIYALIFVIDHNAFKNVVTDSPFSIAFDMTYFSAMTLLTGNNVIEPQSTIAKTVVLVETFILTVYISIIIFGIVEGQKKED